MKKLLFLIIIFQNYGFAQSIKTKDGVVLGERSELIKICQNSERFKEAKALGFNENNLDLFCECYTDNVYCKITYYEFLNVPMKKLRYRHDIYNVIQNCAIKYKNKFKNNVQYKDFKNKKWFIENSIKTCIKNIENEDLYRNLLTDEQIKSFCTCTTNKIIKLNYSHEKLLEINNDEDNVAFNEITMQCLDDILPHDFMTKDVNGIKKKSTIKLIDYGTYKKLKLSFGSIAKYFIFDTGSELLVINEKMKNELLSFGLLKKDYYKYKTKIKLANSKEIDAIITTIDNVQIGDFVLNNVEIAIVKNGLLLCGTNILNKFSNWKIDSQNNILTVYK